MDSDFLPFDASIGANVVKNLPAKERRKRPLCSCIQTSLDFYFQDMEDHLPENLYQLVMSEVELPLLKTVMHRAQGNQTKAAAILGINRSTLRKKLEQYNLT